MADVDLTAFLAARLDEDETIARKVQAAIAAGWNYFDETPTELIDPARALREVAVKRAILVQHGPADGGRDADRCRVCAAITHTGAGQTDARRFRAPCPTLRFLAAIYSDHPDYDQAWEPS
jgi:Family of unknown function (DUF6221)